MGKDGIEELEKLMKDPAAEVKIGAAKTLGEMGEGIGMSGGGIIAVGILDNNPAVQNACILAVDKIGKSGVAALSNLDKLIFDNTGKVSAELKAEAQRVSNNVFARAG